MVESQHEPEVHPDGKNPTDGRSQDLRVTAFCVLIAPLLILALGIALKDHFKFVGPKVSTAIVAVMLSFVSCGAAISVQRLFASRLTKTISAITAIFLVLVSAVGWLAVLMAASLITCGFDLDGIQ